VREVEENIVVVEGKIKEKTKGHLEPVEVVGGLEKLKILAKAFKQPVIVKEGNSYVLLMPTKGIYFWTEAI